MSLFFGAHTDYSLPGGLLATTSYAETARDDGRSLTAGLFHSPAEQHCVKNKQTKKTDINIQIDLYKNRILYQSSHKCRSRERDHSRKTDSIAEMFCQNSSYLRSCS